MPPVHENLSLVHRVQEQFLCKLHYQTSTMFLANRSKKEPTLETNNGQPSTFNSVSVQTGKKSNTTKTTNSRRPHATSLAPPTGLPSAESQTFSWENSWAKEILREAIANQDITDKHTYDEIHHWHPEIQLTDRKKLPGRVRGLVNQVKKDDNAAMEDACAFNHDRKLFPMPTQNYREEPRWQGSDAEWWLKKDVASELHLNMTPYEFYSSRAEYKIYSPDIIRQHIYQEVKFQKWC